MSSFRAVKFYKVPFKLNRLHRQRTKHSLVFIPFKLEPLKTEEWDVKHHSGRRDESESNGRSETRFTSGRMSISVLIGVQISPARPSDMISWENADVRVLTGSSLNQGRPRFRIFGKWYKSALLKNNNKLRWYLQQVAAWIRGGPGLEFLVNGVKVRY